jgi:hypothetical protein
MMNAIYICRVHAPRAVAVHVYVRLVRASGAAYTMYSSISIPGIPTARAPGAGAAAVGLVGARALRLIYNKRSDARHADAAPVSTDSSCHVPFWFYLLQDCE